MEWKGEQEMKKVAMIITGAILTSVLVLVLWGIYGGAGAQDLEGSGAASYDEEPTVSGGVEPLSYGGFALMNGYYVPCNVGQSYSPFVNVSPVPPVNKIILGNAWGSVWWTESFSAWADAYYDSDGEGDCEWGNFAGYADNDYILEMYVEPVLAMDSTTLDEAYFRFYLTDLRVYTSANCTGSYISFSGDYAWTDTHSDDMGSSGNGVTTWKQCEFDTGVSNSSCRIPHRGIACDGCTGYRSYYYKIKTLVCDYEDRPCTDQNSTIDCDTGCFYVNWV
jgi:hypothetical protein